ncbi:MAG: hypothetical protein ACYDBX_01745 [Patescibacteria group bacterium]
MNKSIFAIVVSRVFDFYIVVPIMSIILLLNFGISKFYIAGPILIMIPLILFLIFLIFQIKKTGIDNIDFDLSNIHDRIISSFIVTLWLLASDIVLSIYGINEELLHILYLFTIIIVFATLITFFWKISFHAIMITTLFVLVLIFYKEYSIIVALLIPVVWFSRLVLKKHNIYQLIAGSLLVLVLFSVFYNFGLIMIK